MKIMQEGNEKEKKEEEEGEREKRKGGEEKRGKKGRWRSSFPLPLRTHENGRGGRGEPLTAKIFSLRERESYECMLSSIFSLIFIIFIFFIKE